MLFPDLIPLLAVSADSPGPDPSDAAGQRPCPALPEYDAQVLVVEDDQDLRETLRDVLTFEGYRVAAAENGREALEYLRQDPTVSLILLDLMMPTMSGWEFRTAQLQSPAISAVPVVLVSACSDLRETAAELQVDGYLRKPLELEQLLQVVRRFCG